jgi:hypothetical protein
LYDKKIGNKNKVEKKWIKLSDETRQKIIDTLPAFKKQISDKAYQPFAETYLNNERWNDEIKNNTNPLSNNIPTPETHPHMFAPYTKPIFTT